MLSASSFKEVSWFGFSFLFSVIISFFLFLDNSVWKLFFQHLLEIFVATSQRSVFKVSVRSIFIALLLFFFRIVAINLILLGSSDGNFIKIYAFWRIINIDAFILFHCAEIEIRTHSWLYVVRLNWNLIERRRVNFLSVYRFRLYFSIFRWDKFKQRICWFFLHISRFGR